MQRRAELEERRVFYVAVTRAKEHLILTGHGASHDGKAFAGRPAVISPDLAMIGRSGTPTDLRNTSDARALDASAPVGPRGKILRGANSGK